MDVCVTPLQGCCNATLGKHRAFWCLRHSGFSHFCVKRRFLELFLMHVCFVILWWMSKSKVPANGLVLRECFLIKHLWWIWLKSSPNYHSYSLICGEQSQPGAKPSGWLPVCCFFMVLKRWVVTPRGTCYHMPGVWVVSPPECSNALTVRTHGLAAATHHPWNG